MPNCLNPELYRMLSVLHPCDEPVSSELLPLVYEELRHIANRYISSKAPGQTLQATELVHEAWLSLSKNEAQRWSDCREFMYAASMAMRLILVDRARARVAIKRGGNLTRVGMNEVNLSQPCLQTRNLLIDGALSRLERDDPESARVTLLKFFGGLNTKEIAALEGTSERTIDRRWAYAKVRLLRFLQNEIE